MAYWSNLNGRSRRLACFVALAWIAAMAGCGGGDTALETARTAQPLGAGTSRLNSQSGVPTLQVVAVARQTEVRVSRTVFDYTFRITVRNNSASEGYVDVVADLAAVGQGSTVLQGHVGFDALAAGQSSISSGTVTVRHDRTFPFDAEAWSWVLGALPAIPPLVPGAVVRNELNGTIQVGVPYVTALRIAPLDERNRIVELTTTNPTPGGATPVIDLAGQFTWTPNEADFSTREIIVTAGLADGSRSEFRLAAVVTQVRTAATISLNGAGRYSDSFARYVLDVNSSVPEQPVTGTLTVVERYDVLGNFSDSFLLSDPSLRLAVIRAPELPLLVEQAPQRRRDVRSQGFRGVTTRTLSPYIPAYPICPESDHPALPYCTTVQGQKVGQFALDHIYTTRTDVRGVTAPFDKFASAEVIRIHANCGQSIALQLRDCASLPGTPVILVHGFTPEFRGLGGGADTWGTFADALTQRGHPVFELRWQTNMRFEETAGALVRMARSVAEHTGRKPFIIGHSFGGIVVHLAMAGEAIVWNPSLNQWEKLSAGSADHPLLAGVATLGAPLSGINYLESSMLPVGRAEEDRGIALCYQVTCIQAGAYDNDITWFRALVGVLDGTNAMPLEHGESIFRLHAAWRRGPTGIAIPWSSIHTVVSIRAVPDTYGPDLSDETSYRLSDGLIAMMGQSVLPSDFTSQSGPPFGRKSDYAMDSFVSRYIPSGSFFLQLNDSPLSGGQDTLLRAEINGRNYGFARNAAHSGANTVSPRLCFSGLLSWLITPYKIAGFEDEVEYDCSLLGAVRAAHPLQYFMDEVLRQTDPAPFVPPAISLTIRGLVQDAVTGNLLGGQSIVVRLLDREGKAVGPSDFLLADYGFNIDVSAMLRSRFGAFPPYDDYTVQLEFGNGLTHHAVMYTMPERLRNETTVYDLGTIYLTPTIGAPAFVESSGTVSTQQGVPAPGSTVRLVRGVNLSAEEVLSWPTSNVAGNAVTDADGTFRIVGLLPGVYTALVLAPGYASGRYGSVLVNGVDVLTFALGEILPVPATHPLNDTGVTANHCFAAGSNVLVSCMSPEAMALNDKQDGMVGRDVMHNDDTDGKVGFSFSLVSRPGGGSYDKTECVEDKVTGLMWEGKTVSGLRAGSVNYTNRGDGRAGDASAYVSSVNSLSLCGHNDWRLPDAGELQSLVDYGVAYPATSVDVTWFPNTAAERYWTSSPYQGNVAMGWSVGFGYGFVGKHDRNAGGRVRLVR